MPLCRVCLVCQVPSFSDRYATDSAWWQQFHLDDAATEALIDQRWEAFRAQRRQEALMDREARGEQEGEGDSDSAEEESHDR